jgi:hypothetical protein
MRQAILRLPLALILFGEATVLGILSHCRRLSLVCRLAFNRFKGHATRDHLAGTGSCPAGQFDRRRAQGRSLFDHA